jgi:hypothetical protein
VLSKCLRICDAVRRWVAGANDCDSVCCEAFEVAERIQDNGRIFCLAQDRGEFRLILG